MHFKTIFKIDPTCYFFIFFFHVATRQLKMHLWLIITCHSASLPNGKYKHFNSTEQGPIDCGVYLHNGPFELVLDEGVGFHPMDGYLGEWHSRWVTQHRQKCGKVASSDLGLGFCIRLGSLGSRF